MFDTYKKSTKIGAFFVIISLGGIMISFKEYRLLKRIEKDPVEPELNTLALQPDFMYELKITEFIDNMNKYMKEKKVLNEDEQVLDPFLWKDARYDTKRFTDKEKQDLELVNKLITRNLIEIKEKYLTTRGESEGKKLRYFVLTDLGYNSLLEYKTSYKFWLPIVISIISLVLSIIISG